jgi:hypothetical protein
MRRGSVDRYLRASGDDPPLVHVLLDDALKLADELIPLGGADWREELANRWNVSRPLTRRGRGRLFDTAEGEKRLGERPQDVADRLGLESRTSVPTRVRRDAERSLDRPEQAGDDKN